MKIVNMLGSPRKNGTSARIARAFVEEAESRGATVESYYLNGMSHMGCQACELCHTKQDHCAVKDELTPALESIREADLLLLSSPIYFGDLSGQLRLFFDRTYSMIEPTFATDPANASRLKPGAKVVLVLAQENGESSHLDIAERYSRYLDVYGHDKRIIRATDLNGRPDASVDAEIEQARAAAREMLA